MQLSSPISLQSIRDVSLPYQMLSKNALCLFDIRKFWGAIHTDPGAS